MLKVSNFTSPRSGLPVPNQFIINDTKAGKMVFQSYSTVIAERHKGHLTLDIGALDYSRTTSKYLYMFTNKKRKELEQGIADGSIKVTNLNTTN